MLGLIWFQIDRNSDVTPERIFWKKLSWKISADDNKSMKNYTACKELKNLLFSKNYSANHVYCRRPGTSHLLS